jgi:hypothetical protein
MALLQKVPGRFLPSAPAQKIYWNAIDWNASDKL